VSRALEHRGVKAAAKGHSIGQVTYLQYIFTRVYICSHIYKILAPNSSLLLEGRRIFCAEHRGVKAAAKGHPIGQVTYIQYSYTRLYIEK